MKYYTTPKGYYYKVYSNGKKKRISKKSAMKNMKGGYTNFTKAPFEFYNSDLDINLLDEYNIITQRTKIIGDILFPVGIHDMINTYKNYRKLLNTRMSMRGKNGFGNLSQLNYNYNQNYGVYFSLCKKNKITEVTKYCKGKLCIFDILKLFTYINNKINKYDIPILYFNQNEEYGNEETHILEHNKIKELIHNIEEHGHSGIKISSHEIVCRIPIPLNQTSGLIEIINCNYKL